MNSFVQQLLCSHSLCSHQRCSHRNSYKATPVIYCVIHIKYFFCFCHYTMNITCMCLEMQRCCCCPRQYKNENQHKHTTQIKLEDQSPNSTIIFLQVLSMLCAFLNIFLAPESRQNPGSKSNSLLNDLIQAPFSSVAIILVHVNVTIAPLACYTWSTQWTG